MSKRIRSSRGEMVDFDLLKIKEQIAANPPAIDVRARQDFIDRRLRRRVKKVPAPAPKIKGEITDPVLPGTEELSEPTKMIDGVTVAEPTSTTSQKARPKK